MSQKQEVTTQTLESAFTSLKVKKIIEAPLKARELVKHIAEIEVL